MTGNNLVYIVLDSCRYDSFLRAATPNLDRLGQAERRYSFASWTSPSHFTLLMGQVPHTSPRRVFASEVYKEQFAKVGSSRVDLQACKLEYSIVSPK